MFRKIRNYSSTMLIAGDVWAKCHDKTHTKAFSPIWEKAYSKSEPCTPKRSALISLYIEKLENIG